MCILYICIRTVNELCKKKKKNKQNKAKFYCTITRAPCCGENVTSTIQTEF